MPDDRVDRRVRAFRQLALKLGIVGRQARQRSQVAARRGPGDRHEVAVAAELVDIGPGPGDRRLDVHDVRRPRVVRRDPVVDRQTDPALLRPDATSTRSPAASDCRAPRRRRARRAAPVPASAGRSSRRHTSSNCVGRGAVSHRRPVHVAAVLACLPERRGALRSAATRSRDPWRRRRPRNAASVTAVVLSRSWRLSSAFAGSLGVNSDFAVAPIMSGACRAPQIPAAVRAPSGSRCFPINGSDAEATLKASKWSDGPAFSNHCRRVVRVGPGYRISGRSVIARAYPAGANPNDNLSEVVYSASNLSPACDVCHTYRTAASAR